MQSVGTQFVRPESAMVFVALVVKSITFQKASRVCFPAKREQLEMFQGLVPESRGQNLVLTVLHVPYSLDVGQKKKRRPARERAKVAVPCSIISRSGIASNRLFRSSAHQRHMSTSARRQGSEGAGGCGEGRYVLVLDEPHREELRG